MNAATIREALDPAMIALNREVELAKQALAAFNVQTQTNLRAIGVDNRASLPAHHVDELSRITAHCESTIRCRDAVRGALAALAQEAA